MANNRKKKKKNQSAAARQQAAAAYMSKNSSSVQKPQPKKVEESVKEEPIEIVAPSAPQPKKTAPAPEKKQTKKAVKKQPKFKADKVRAKKEHKEKVRAFGVNKILAIVLAFCVLLAGASVLTWWLSNRFVVPAQAIPAYAGRDISNERTLAVSGDSVAQKAAADKMPRKGDVALFDYYAERRLELAESYCSVMLNLSNPFNNNCVFIASIVDEAGNVCYQSQGLPAGRCLTEIRLSDKPYGSYDMHLVVAAYDPESYELLGVQYSDLSVQIGFEEETTNAAEK